MALRVVCRNPSLDTHTHSSLAYAPIAGPTPPPVLLPGDATRSFRFAGPSIPALPPPAATAAVGLGPVPIHTSTPIRRRPVPSTRSQARATPCWCRGSESSPAWSCCRRGSSSASSAWCGRSFVIVCWGLRGRFRRTNAGLASLDRRNGSNPGTRSDPTTTAPAAAPAGGPPRPPGSTAAAAVLLLPLLGGRTGACGVGRSKCPPDHAVTAPCVGDREWMRPYARGYTNRHTKRRGLPRQRLPTSDSTCLCRLNE